MCAGHWETYTLEHRLYLGLRPRQKDLVKNIEELGAGCAIARVERQGEMKHATTEDVPGVREDG